jgi:hypothetical protein
MRRVLCFFGIDCLIQRQEVMVDKDKRMACEYDADGQSGIPSTLALLILRRAVSSRYPCGYGSVVHSHKLTVRDRRRR